MDNSNSQISLACRHQAAARKPTFPRSNSAPLPVSLGAAQTLVAASAIASCISELPHATSKSSYEEKQKFLARVEWLPVTSRSYVTHSQTDNCKISIMNSCSCCLATRYVNTFCIYIEKYSYQSDHVSCI